MGEIAGGGGLGNWGEASRAEMSGQLGGGRVKGALLSR